MNALNKVLNPFSKIFLLFAFLMVMTTQVFIQSSVDCSSNAEKKCSFVLTENTEETSEAELGSEFSFEINSPVKFSEAIYSPVLEAQRLRFNSENSKIYDCYLPTLIKPPRRS